MTTYELTYFDTNGGRAEPLRLAFHIGGIPFTDNRIDFPTFMQMRGSTPFSAIPVLDIDGQPVSQSNAMLRYVGKQVGLYPEDNLQALWCDEALDAVEDVLHALVSTFGLKDEALKAAREELAAGRLTTFIKGLSRLLERAGNSFFAAEQLTIADLKVMILVQWLRRGVLDHIPADLVDTLAPNLVAHAERLGQDPRIVEYYAQHP